MGTSGLAVITCSHCGAHRVATLPQCVRCGRAAEYGAPAEPAPRDSKVEAGGPVEQEPFKRRPKPPNKTEQAVRDHLSEPGDTWLFGGLQLLILDGAARYTCDWFVIKEDGGKPWVVECKSSKRHHHSHNRAQTAFTAAQQQYGHLFEFKWVEV